MLHLGAKSFILVEWFSARLMKAVQKATAAEDSVSKCSSEDFLKRLQLTCIYKFRCSKEEWESTRKKQSMPATSFTKNYLVPKLIKFKWRFCVTASSDWVWIHFTRSLTFPSISKKPWPFFPQCSYRFHQSSCLDWSWLHWKIQNRMSHFEWQSTQNTVNHQLSK